ncbi:hypothetical protein Tco_0444608, partial [Tanacetum coccineum]
EIVARERERKARTTLLMALTKDHLAKFHKMTDAKEMWDAIKSRFGGNDESKKMQKYILKQQFEGFSVSNSEGLLKGYDRFQSLLRHFARECRIKGTQDNRRRDAWNSGNKDGSRIRQKEDSKALVTIDGEGVDWTNHSEDEDYALMACNSSDSVTESVFMNKESELEKQPLYDRFVIADGMQYYSQFTYGPKQTQPSESSSQTSEFDTCESNISTEPSELVSEPVVNESNIECQPKVWSDAPIIEEYESDSEEALGRFTERWMFHAHDWDKALPRLEFQDCNGGPVDFGGSKGYSTVKEVDINKKTENQAKMTKLSMEWKRLPKSGKWSKECQSPESILKESAVQTGAE